MNNAKETMSLIRDLARQKNVSINKMLSDCGLGKSLIVDSESKNSLPTADKLAKIAEYFNVSTDFILKGEEIYRDLNPEQKELLDLYDHLDDIQKAEVRGYLKAKAEKH